MKQTNVCFLMRDNQVLLAMKKRGLGEGKWNGVGGKKHDDETIEQATVREVEEEIAVKLREEDLINRGIITFVHEGNPDWNQDMTIFIVKKWEGEPSESEEMKPQWFAVDKVPYESMWLDDPHWLPSILAGKKIKANFIFSEDGKEFLKKEVTVIEE